MINELISNSIFQFVFVIGFFAVLVYVSNHIVHNSELIARFKKSRFSNLREYFPSEESFRQEKIFSFLDDYGRDPLFLPPEKRDLYGFSFIFDWKEGFYLIYALDIIVSIYLTTNMSKDSNKDKVLLFLLTPFGSITGIVFGNSIIILLDVFHIIGYLYFIQVYYRKFVSYTENKGLGITILLLFSIILVSFIFTIITEGVSPMDSMTMVSNAFTSNSFDASGKMMIGKINSLILAWGGFILSGVGTATLAVSIANRFVDHQFDEIKDSIKKKREEN